MERKNQKTKSVGNGEGTLYFSDSLQCWVFQYWYNNKRKTMKQRKNEKVKDFKARVTETKSKLNNNVYIEEKCISLYQLLESYIENKHNSGITQDRTYLRDKENLKLLEKCCNNFIYKPIQKVTTKDLTVALPNFIERKIDGNTPKIYSQNIINKLYMLLNKGFKIAISERITIYNIMDSEVIKKPKAKKETEEVKALTIQEEKKLINVFKSLNHKYKKIILLTLFTGLRIGETLALTRDNVNLIENTIIIEKTLTRDKNDKTILGNKTKTQAGKRKVLLSKNANLILNEILDNNVTNIYNLIFYDYEKNTFITPSEINCYLQRLNNKYRICKHIHTHMLRHTYATRCIEAGMSAKVLQKNLGHKKITTTLDTYTSVFDRFNEEENKKYDLYMKKIGI